MIVVIVIRAVFLILLVLFTVDVTVHISSGLILSYEIIFVGLAQDITNNFGSVEA